MVATCTLGTSHFSGNVFLCFLSANMVPACISIAHWCGVGSIISLPRYDPGIYSYLQKQPETFSSQELRGNLMLHLRANVMLYHQETDSDLY